MRWPWQPKPPKRREQTTYVSCPTCELDQYSCAECFVDDTDLVRYRCARCGTRSEWLFDAPVPLLIRHKALG